LSATPGTLAEVDAAVRSAPAAPRRAVRVEPGAGVTALVASVLLLTILSSLGAWLTAREMESRMTAMVGENMPSVVAAEELQSALLQQRGLVAAYMLDDGRLAWVNDLDKLKPELARRLADARQSTRTDEERNLLAQLVSVYADYDAERERAITLYHDGHAQEARDLLLGDVSRLSDQAYGICRQLAAANQRFMSASLERGHQKVGSLALILPVLVGVTTLLCLGVLLIVSRRLLRPMRRLARDARSFSAKDPTQSHTSFEDDVHELEFYSRALMTDVTRTRTDLKESQGRLVAAEKLAAVGRFAAAATHEIRSPLTSIKMWLFQLKQTAGQEADARHAIAVLEGEIARLEDLATSFLQFSRPPSLRLSRQCVSEIVDSTVELAQHRLNDRGVRIERSTARDLPAIKADAQQLRQVLLNLLANAVDATPKGGVVRISESREPSGNGRDDVVLRIRDEGHGVPDSVRERLFEPFVTTKPHGTGLGLAVASSIIAQHGGQLVLEDQEGSGAVFAVRIAACED
jgi:signal transduction histidine kinase